MKKVILITFHILFAGTLMAQTGIEYQLCDQDFRPLYMHKDLPENAVYTDTNASADARAADVIKRLSFDEKLMLTGGWKQMHFPAVKRLGLPPVYFSDASQGVHVKNLCVKVERSTAFPCELALAATWDPELAYTYAKSIGEECQAWGISVLLGPGLNMYRNAEGGRNFEYMGEDPFLTSNMGVQYVKGLQSTRTLATIKHFIGNEQELARHAVNVEIGERALREIYLRPFEECIKKGDALAVMTGNNMVNGFPGAADKPLSGGILRKEFGFKGIIMSDWANSMFWPKKQNLELTSGHSLLMADNKLFADYIQKEIKENPEKKSAVEKELEQMIYYNLFAFFKNGVYDRPYRNPAWVSKISDHKKVALQTAEEAITLLKNESKILPVDPAKVDKIAVIGTDEALNVYVGKGSGRVEGYDQINYLDGLKNIYGNKIVHDPNISDEAIKTADVVLYFINKPAGESSDVNFNLPDAIAQSINKYAALNKNLVVIFSGGNGFAMPWLQKAKGLVFAYLLGQESGTAMANIISGKVNPSGKLPFTIEKDFKDSPAYDYNKMSDGKYYWGGGRGDSKMMTKFGKIDITYKEGIYTGYRWFDKKNIEPQFPFGFGLSYTTFKYSDIKCSSSTIKDDQPVNVSITVKNTGKVAGAEIAQLYVHAMKSTVDRPVKELKGFKRVFLEPGESKTLNIPVSLNDLAYWSEDDHQWKVDPGQYLIEVGPSSNDIKQKITITR